MSDYIKREDAIKAVAEYTNDCFGTFEDAILNAEDVVLDSVPSADVIEPKRGKWIDKGWKGDWQFETDGRGNCWREYECSECGFYNKGGKPNFCPNCGARMKGADDE